jgi:hypothetical protein
LSLTKPLSSVLDHLVLAAPNVEKAVERLQSLCGVRAAVGGRHPAWGTANALFSLGPRMYLEVIGPDPLQARPAGGRPFGLDGMTEPRLVTWVARAENLQAIKEAAASHRVDLGEILERSRQLPDGHLLKWSMTDLMKDREGGIVPYFINWGDSPHPAEGAPKGCALRRLKAVHPEADRLTRILKHLGLDLVVEAGPAARLAASIETPLGPVDIE